MNIKKKALPNPARPFEVAFYYIDQMSRLLQVWIRYELLDPFGFRRRRDFKALLDYKGTGSGRACLVLANGPSVKKLDPQKVSHFCKENKVDLFCVNFFVNTKFAEITGADFWVLSDPYSFDLSKSEVQNSFNNAGILIRSGLFAPAKYEKIIPQNTNLPYVVFNDMVTSHMFSQSISPIKPRSYASMSAYKALAIAVFGGYSPIYICGFDNSYVKCLGCDRDNRIYRINEHFDKQAYAYSNPLTYLDYKHRSVSDELLAYSRLFSDLWKFQGHNIINLDVDSLTDAFPKEDSLDLYIADN